MRRLAVGLTLAALAALAAAAIAQAPSIARFSAAAPGAAPPAGWTALVFPRIPRHTRYAIVDDAGTPVVAARAEGSASGWVTRLDVPTAAAPMLRWRWKAERLPEGADTRQKAGDDAAARVYVLFRQSPEKLTLVQRAIDEATRLVYGEVPPYASLMYVWDERAPAGASFVNPYTDRVRTIVVESGRARLDRWIAYERDLAADFRAAFGEEAPAIAGVAIMTDTDNTGSVAAARYGDVTLSPR